MTTKKATVFYSLLVLLAAIVIAGNIVAGTFHGVITQRLCGFGIDYDSPQAAESFKDGAAVATEIERRGAVLLKNENDVLPLKAKKVNIFGWNGSDDGIIYEGGGSSAGSESKKISLREALASEGIEANPELVTAYKNLGFKLEADTWAEDSKYYRMCEPGEEFYTTERMKQAKEYSDTAIVVIARRAGEGRDLIKFQYDENGNKDDSHHYLQLSTKEELMLREVKGNFDKIVVIVNTGNTLELGFTEDELIDAVLYIGFPGNNGYNAVAEILSGKTTPSGHNTDTWAYDLSTAPSWYNIYADGLRSAKIYTGGGSFSYIDYAESIYVGYRWYETADAAGYWDGVENEYGKGYEGVVQFPFGYGLSYADFKWTVTETSFTSGATLSDKNTKITIKVLVENVSAKYSGADVVQLYVSAPYYDGGIEKSSVQLCAFAKTAVLKPGEAEELTLSCSLYDFASYDCYDRNNNGFMGYEIEKGEYTLSLRTDAHTVATTTNGKSTLFFRIAEDMKFDKDTTTGYEVENRFTNYSNPESGAESVLPSDEDPVYSKLFAIDGEDSGQNITYLSRSNFADTFPKTRPARKINSDMYSNVLKEIKPKINPDDVMPKTGSKDTSYTLNDVAGLSYDDEKWDALISQLTVDEIGKLCADGGYHTIDIESINKTFCKDLDGPTGLVTGNTGATAGKATSYPCDTIVACSFDWKLAYQFGCQVGKEATALGVGGWYAPGANTHRSPFGGRNSEYYSEDGYLAGIMAAYEVKGCIQNGLYCYLKHFAVNDSDVGRNGQCRWLTEQALREIYLKPFEIAVKVGGCNGIMSSVDRIGCIRASGNYQLLTEVLRNEWGFRGSVVSDYYQDFTHIGSSVHDIDEFVRAGNDLALDPSGTINMFNDKSSATAVKAMQKSAKNILYTYINTRHITATEKGLDLSAVIGKSTKVFAWWVIVLVAIDVLVAAGIAFGAVAITKSVRKHN